MLFTHVLKVFLLLNLSNVLCIESDLGDCDIPCNEHDQSPICVLNTNEVCFRMLPSKCYMDLMNCKFQFGYTIYIDSYCKLEAFKCNDQPIFQSPAVNNGLMEDDQSSVKDFETIFTNDYGSKNEVE